MPKNYCLCLITMSEKVIKFLILGEGTSDTALEQPIRWLLDHHQFDFPFEFAPASDACRGHHLKGKLEKAMISFLPDVIFVHRDADQMGYEARESEIDTVVHELSVHYAIPVIPVKMLETWLLIDENAIRRAAGNPSGTVPLSIPRVNRLENIADPKTQLLRTLRIASELTGRRLKKFNVYQARRRVAEEIESFKALLDLSSFQKLSHHISALGESLRDS